MISTKQSIYNSLSTVLANTQYDLFTDSSKVLPAISYKEDRNIDNKTGDTLGYSTINYNVKLWVNTVADMELYAPQIDSVMRNLGFSRINAYETIIDNIICKDLTYQGLAIENYNNNGGH